MPDKERKLKLEKRNEKKKQIGGNTVTEKISYTSFDVILKDRWCEEPLLGPMIGDSSMTG